jgi:hypothetical protein
MRQLTKISIITFALNTLLFCGLLAQQYNVPLTMEGLNHTMNNSAVSSGMGGITIPLQQDVAVMFTNPAGLSSLNKLTISVGGIQTFTSAEHTQQWYPLVYFGNFSLLMDGTARGIGPSGTGSLPSTTGRGPGDTLQQPFDDIWPNWKRNKNSTYVPQIFAALPFKIKEMAAAVGIGVTQYSNMNYYYRNSNTLNPDYDLITIPLSTGGAPDSVRCDWRQEIHSREGSMYGYGGAFSISVLENLSLGISARLLSGSTDDYEQTLGRGVIWIYGSNWVQRRWPGASGSAMVLDSVDYERTLIGTSDFSGLDATFSALYKTKNVTFGISVTPPSTIERKFSGKLAADTGATIDYHASQKNVDTSFTEEMTLPLRGKVGIGFQVNPSFLVAFEYEFLPYAKAEFKKNGVTTRPWLDASVIRFGVNWVPTNYLDVRCGYRKHKETFAPKNAAFLDQPVSYNAYTLGAGIKLMPGLTLDIAYEYYQVKYEDVWAESYIINKNNVNNISAQVSYLLPFKLF